MNKIYIFFREVIRCFRKTSFFCKGTSENWQKIIDRGSLIGATEATIYYYSETEPRKLGNYWHYGSNGNVVEW